MKTHTSSLARPTTRRRILAGSIATALLLAPTVQSATVFWDGGGADVNWSTVNNWGTSGANTTTDPGAVPGSTDDVVFYSTGATQLTTNIIDQAFTLQSLTFGNSKTGAVTIGGTSVLTLNGKLNYDSNTLSSGTVAGITSTATLGTAIYVQAGSGAITIDAPITLGAAQQWVNNSSNTLTIQTGALTNGANNLTIGGTGNTTISSSFTGSGAGGVTKVGAGTLTLSGANTYTGTTNIGAGKITLSGGNDRLATTGTVNFSGSSTLDLGSTSQTLDNLTVANGVTGTVNGSGGTLNITGSAFRIGSTTTASAQTLNLAGLSTFDYNNATGTFRVSSSFAGGSGTMTLGTTNTITALSLGVGSDGFGATTGTRNVGTLNLGQTNTLNATTITVGVNFNNGTLKFNTSLAANPTLTIRATDTSGRANMTVGQAVSSPGTTSSIDLVTGVSGTSSLDAQIGTLTLGLYNRSAGNTQSPGATITGSFTMGGGTLDATNIILGQVPNTGTGGSSSGNLVTTNGTFTTGSGTVKVGTLTIVDKVGTGAFNAVNGTFNLNAGGILRAETIKPGTSGSGTLTRTFNWNDGTIQNYDASTNLTINIGLTLTLAATGTHTFNIDTNRTGTVAAVLAGADGTLVKTGNGTLILSTTNTYTGATTVNGGIFNVTGSINNTSAVNINSGTLQLGASNVINDAAAVNLGGGTLASGGFSEGAATTLGLGVLSLTANSTIDFGTGAAGILNFSSLGTHTASTTLSILNWSGTALAAGTSGINDRLIFGGTDITTFTNLYNQADVSFNGISGYQAIQFDPNYFEVVAIPEPGSLLLGGLSFLILLRRRRGA